MKRKHLIKAFFECRYLDEEDLKILGKEQIVVEDWFREMSGEYEQRICLVELDDKEKELVKNFVCEQNKKYVDVFDYIIFYK